ncbi:ABC transporter substrate-binding protein [Methyloprofundus sedimenti]|uniref:ABC transporter substrate-binding protein n=2 Tax=Methyloprofundus sedimenti TaxID=1420851 RepID=A0A1V8M394_9GAMM|nr:ABC transporter substrate-binding protein [Methyloprofundus sedimenti]
MVIIGVAWLFLPLSENDTSPKTDLEKLVLTGSSTVAPLAAEIGKRFESLHPDVRIDVQTGGSSRGVNDARSGLANIGMASRALKENETDLLNFTLALDGISLIIHQTNPVRSLSKQQIIDIYTGKIANWQEVGGNDAPITVVNKAEGRSTLELFLHYFALNNTQVKPHVVIGDNQQGIKSVAGNPDAIGYVSVGSAEYEAMHNVPIKLLPLDGIVASVENVRNRRFPLSRPLNLITRAVPTGIAKEFIEFASSAQVNDLIEAQYFVPVAH